MARRPCWERPLPSVQSPGREQAACWQGGMGGAFARPASPAPLLVPRRQGQKQLLWQERGSQGLGSASVLPPGASSCPRALPHGAGLCRCPPLPTGWGAAGPHAASPLFLQLAGAEGAVAGHTAGVRRGGCSRRSRTGQHSSPAGDTCPRACGQLSGRAAAQERRGTLGSPTSLPLPSRCTGHQKEAREPGSPASHPSNSSRRR